MASGGTIFLDEIGELPLELQPKLLRVLQEGQVERLGGVRTVSVDVRIIAATNRNLTDDVRRGQFRQDLFYRLNVFPITLPSLRQRRDDLPGLVRYLSDRFGRQLGRRIDRIGAGSLEALERHDWPGNIRELENVIQQAIITSRDGVLDMSDFTGVAIDPAGDRPCFVERVRPLVEAERDHIRYVLEHARWRIEGAGGAADLLGLHPSTLRTKMQKLGIERPAARVPIDRWAGKEHPDAEGLPGDDSNPRFGTPSGTCPPLEMLDTRAGRAAVPPSSWHTRFENDGGPG